MNERILFGLLIIVGYFGVALVSSFFPMVPESRGTLRDVLLTVGPILGMIAQAIWKTDKSEHQQADTINTLANRVPQMPVSGSVHFESGPTNEEATSEATNVANRGTEMARQFRASPDSNK